jgi:hypothetical protein
VRANVFPAATCLVNPFMPPTRRDLGICATSVVKNVRKNRRLTHKMYLFWRSPIVQPKEAPYQEKMETRAHQVDPLPDSIWELI